MTKTLDELFEIATNTENKQIAVKTEQDIAAEELEESHAFTNKALRDLIATAQNVLENAADVANQTGNPEAINAFSNLFKNIGETAAKVLKAHGEKVKIDKMAVEKPKQAAENSPQTVNNTQIVFNGTTSDLLDKVLDEKNKVIDVPSQRT